MPLHFNTHKQIINIVSEQNMCIKMPLFGWSQFLKLANSGNNGQFEECLSKVIK